MLDGESIVGDDIVYMRKKNGNVRAVNVEKGIFGIIQGINSKDYPIQWDALHSPGEIIFSNVLVTEDKGVHWVGKNGKVPPVVIITRVSGGTVKRMLRVTKYHARTQMHALLLSLSNLET